MFKETNNEELFIPPESPKKMMKRPIRDNEKRMMTAFKDLTKQFVNNFSLHSKERKGHKYNAAHKEEIMTNGVILNVLSNK